MKALGRATWRCAAAMALAVALAGCGNDPSANARFAYFKTLGGYMFNAGKKDTQPTGQADPESMARASLAYNKGPMILASFESGYFSVLGMTGENGAMRTYFTPTKQAVILRDGILIGTRGFGFDLQSADTDATSQLIRMRKPGTAKMTLRYLDGEGVERPLPMTCRIVVGKPMSYPFAGQTWSGTQVGQACEGQGLKIDNGYVVAQDGAILSSRQFVAPNFGYVTIQTVRR